MKEMNNFLSNTESCCHGVGTERDRETEGLGGGGVEIGDRGMEGGERDGGGRKGRGERPISRD